MAHLIFIRHFDLAACHRYQNAHIRKWLYYFSLMIICRYHENRASQSVDIHRNFLSSNYFLSKQVGNLYFGYTVPVRVISHSQAGLKALCSSVTLSTADLCPCFLVLTSSL